MNESTVDLLIFLVIIGAAVVLCGTLLWGIYRLIDKVQALHEARRRRETVAAVKLYYAVKRRIPGEITPEEYDQAIRYVIQKDPELADRHGGLNLRGQDQERLAELISEAYQEIAQKGEKIA